MTPKSLTKISVGYDGTTWGLDSSNQIWVYNFRLLTWTQQGGTLVQLSVGGFKNIAGLNSSGGLYIFNRATQTWTFRASPTGKVLQRVSIGGDGDLWAIDSTYYAPGGGYGIWHWTGTTWESIYGSLTQISVGQAGDIWGLNSDIGKIWKYNGNNTWTLVAGTGAVTSQIAVGFDGTVWVLDPVGNVYKYNGSGWTQMPGIAASYIAGGGIYSTAAIASGQPYHLTTSDPL